MKNAFLGVWLGKRIKAVIRASIMRIGLSQRKRQNWQKIRKDCQFCQDHAYMVRDTPDPRTNTMPIDVTTIEEHKLSAPKLCKGLLKKLRHCQAGFVDVAVVIHCLETFIQGIPLSKYRQIALARHRCAPPTGRVDTLREK